MLTVCSGDYLEYGVFLESDFAVAECREDDTIKILFTSTVFSLKQKFQ